MLTVTALTVAVLLATGTYGDDQGDALPPSSTTDLPHSCVEKPCGPLVCQARCVASCLDTGVAASIAECSEQFCSGFDENTPCVANDTECWQTCGFDQSPDDRPAPSTVENLRVDPYANGFSTSSIDPYKISIQWEPANDASLYIVQAFPMYGKNASQQSSQPVMQNMTAATKLSFDRPDLCTVYMIRVTSVNAFGTSRSSYLVSDTWKPELHFDENFDVRSIRREGDLVNVLIDYSPPPTWRAGDVYFDDSSVRAYQCLGPLNDTIISKTQPDTDGYYTPMVFINETGTKIILSFPAEIMYSKCLFSYRVTSLRTRCNLTVPLNAKGPSSAGVDFTINCLSAKNSNCDQQSDSSKVAPQSQSQSQPQSQPQPQPQPQSAENLDNTTLGDGELVIVMGPASGPDNSSSAQQDSKESADKVAPVEKASGSQESPTPLATHSQPGMGNSGEIVILFPDTAPFNNATRGVGANVPPSNSIQDQPSSSDHGDSSSDAKSAEAPPPFIVIVEPRDPNAPLCTLAEFDAEIYSKKLDDDAQDSQTVDLVLSWLEDTSQFTNQQKPSFFLIRYGEVPRSLVVDPEPVLLSDKVVRTPLASSSAEVSRAFKLTGLSPKSLYAVQICAVYPTEKSPPIPWDTAPRYMVDLSAPRDTLNIDLRSTTKIPQAPQPSNGSEYDIMDFFFDVMNTSADALDEIAKQPASNGRQQQPASNSAESHSASKSIEKRPASKNAGHKSASSSAESHSASKSVEKRPASKHAGHKSGSKSASKSAENQSKNVGSSGDDGAVLEIDLPLQPSVMNVDVKPIIIEDTSSWASFHSLWVFFFLIFVAMIIAAGLIFACKRGRKGRYWQKHQQFQPSPVSPISFPPPTATVAPPEVKIPV